MAERAAGIGAPVSIETSGNIVHGVFETLDEEGRLVLRASDNSQIVDRGRRCAFRVDRHDPSVRMEPR